MNRALTAGIFVGGKSERMGSPKGLLCYGQTTLIERWVALFEQMHMRSVLVGARAEYAHLGIPMIDDDATAVGPCAGLSALFSHVVAVDGERERYVIAVACDMPYVPRHLVERLRDMPDAASVAARREDLWEPFFARYDPKLVRPVLKNRIAKKQFDLQGILKDTDASELPMSAAELSLLDDWDSPSDVPMNPGQREP